MNESTTLKRCRPEEAGIPSGAISSFICSVEEKGLELHSFMILRHGRMAAEGWWDPYGPDRPHMLFSLSKSFTSTAIGFAVSEGLISVDDLVVSFFPEDVPEALCENMKAMRIRHLLTMSTGHAEDATEKTRSQSRGSWVRNFLATEVELQPGTKFVYNSAATYMLSAIITKVTGERLLDYLKPRLFEPLGIENPVWETCPSGINTGGWGLSIKTADIARFGQLYLQKGVWEGKRILPEEWVDEATSSHIYSGPNPAPDWTQGYGYQFWKCRHNAYRGDGAFGQFCIAIPEKDAVIAITSGVGDMQAVLDRVWEHLLPAMADNALPADDKAYTALKAKLASLALPPDASGERPAFADEISGKYYATEENVLGIKALRIDFGIESCSIESKTESGSNYLQCGYGRWIYGKALLMDPHADPNASGLSPAVACCAWQDEHSMLVTLRFYETPFFLTMLFNFEGSSLNISVKINVSFGYTGPVIIKGHLRED